jgi:hypothetical protein
VSERRNNSKALEDVVANLADHRVWLWSLAISQRDAADHCLRVMMNNGLIEGRRHPYGGNVWKVGNKLFGRTDGVTLKSFKKLLKT